MDLLRLSENKFRLSGIYHYKLWNYKYVEIDGEKYQNRFITDEFYDCDNNFPDIDKFEYEEHFNRYVFNLENDIRWIGEIFEVDWLNVKIIFYYPDLGLYKNLLESYFSGKSTNYVVNIYSWIFENSDIERDGIFDYKCVTNCYNSKKNDIVINNFKHLSIPLELFSYGFNNSFYIEIPLKNILKLNFSFLPQEVKSQIKHIFLKDDCGYRKNIFFKDLLPEKYFSTNLNEIEVINILTEVYKRKVKLFAEAKKIYKNSSYRNKHIINYLN